MPDYRINEEEIDLTNAGNRTALLEEIRSEENVNRKRDQQKRLDVYNDRQDIYILERLRREFSFKTVQEMRKILSINLAKRIIDEKSSVYNRPPKRVFSTQSGSELSEAQLAQLNALYWVNNVNASLKGANIGKTRHDQCALMVTPDNEGKIRVRPIMPVHYDVIPSSKDPEKAYAYILNVWNKDLRMTARDGTNEPTQMRRYKGNNHVNESIADDDDYKMLMQRYVVWTADIHFTMNGHGKIIGEIEPNPIGMLPFIDVAPYEKDFQFFIRRGSSTIDFSLDYGMMLSDNSNVIRLQSYSQAVISSEKVPVNMTIGPNHVLHLKLDPKRPELSPKFEFITPNPDLAGTQAFMESLLNLHLTSEGMDTAVVTGRPEGVKFTSGIDRLLSMISKFEATRDDFEMFRGVEDKLVDRLTAWSNLFQTVSGEGELDASLKQATLPDDVEVDVLFSEPEAIQTKADLEESLDKLREGGYKSRIDVISEIHGVDRDKAIELAQQIDEDERLYGELSGEIVEDVSTDIQEE